MNRPWVVCQIGAREHYVLARELHRRGLLRALVTEAWAPEGSWPHALPGTLARRFADRSAPGLDGVRVEHFTAGAMTFEATHRLRGTDNWARNMARNRWFAAQTARRLRRRGLLAGRPVVFSYSYGALEILRAARDAGCTTVLGQIDPATTEEAIVADAAARHAELRPRWNPAPAEYWRLWREECALADRIVVNSEWARAGLEQAGIDPAKLRVVPLAYEDAPRATPRSIPERFDESRPLRVLFLGSVIVRKGIAEVLEAARLLKDRPVEIHLVGGAGVALPEAAGDHRRLRIHGSVPRAAVHGHFAAADLFLLPTLSDGFGLTLIEAQAHGLPVIASRRCGDVVRDGVDGTVLDAVSGPAVAAAIEAYLAQPALVARQGAAALDNVARFVPERIGEQLLAAVADAGTEQGDKA